MIARRRRVIDVLFSATIVATVATSPVPAQPRSAPGVIDGLVTDAALLPVTDATASILGSGVQVVTGANGRFRMIGVPPGQYFLVVRRLGFAPASVALQVAGADTLRLSFTLDRVTALDTVVIATKRYSMRLAEFEEHRKLGFGQFMTQAEIEKRNSVGVSDLMRTFLGVDVIEGRAFSHRFGNHIRACPYQTYLDGILLPGQKLDDLPAIPRDLAGIEVYNGAATIPLQYKNSSGGWCGVILMWTRGG